MTKASAPSDGLREAERLLEEAVAFLANHGGYQWPHTLRLVQQARAALATTGQPEPKTGYLPGMAYGTGGNRLAQPEDTRTADLPERVIVDQHGHYWRDYGDSLSMCPVSTENNETEVAATYIPDGAFRLALIQIEHDGEVINRLTQALRVATHSPHDRDGEPNEGFPTCSGCGAILTGEDTRTAVPGGLRAIPASDEGDYWEARLTLPTLDQRTVVAAWSWKWAGGSAAEADALAESIRAALTSEATAPEPTDV